MVEGVLTDEDVSELEQQLIVAMPSQGPIGNGALRNKLGWDEDRYWYIRNRLLQAGAVVTGRGRGGSVLRVVPLAPSDAERLESIVPRVAEKDLYDPIVTTIRTHWVPDHQIQDFVIDCTAQQGRRDTGGKWTRPDVTLASCNTYKFVPGKQVELNTFEVKTSDGLDVTAVYEALAHRRAAHYSYVLAYVPESERAVLKSLLDRLCGDADEHGVGFIVVAEVSDYETWDFEVEPSRNDPDPADLDNFIRTQTSDEFKDRILSWCRTL
ncbi:MAG: hypothetical protein JSR66_31660 [Proteobacteria bacterium]|nr:hypothetical protein [Pseudomonadota bacterium]